MFHPIIEVSLWIDFVCVTAENMVVTYKAFYNGGELSVKMFCMVLDPPIYVNRVMSPGTSREGGKLTRQSIAGPGEGHSCDLLGQGWEGWR